MLIDNKTYLVMSVLRCEKYCKQKHDKPSIIISISSKYESKEHNVFISDQNNVKAILRLSFADIEKEDDANECMSIKDGKKVADFINKWFDLVDTIIVHCEGGISRSAGVMAAILRVKTGDDYKIFKNHKKAPNMTCYLHTLKGFKYI